jgi:hypothetical protein
MAKIKVTEATKIVKPKKKGLAAKTKTSSSKNSKNYVKPYKGQGR